MSDHLNNTSIFVVIPAYNEEVTVRHVVEELVDLRYNVILVDDGSEIKIKDTISQLPNIYILRHEVNLGQGAAIQTGIRFALNKQAEYIITFDADAQHSAADIKSLLEPLQNNEADIALGSRFLKKGSHNATAGRQFILKTGRLINYLFTGLYLSDSHNGLRAMTRMAAQKINLKENRMAHATEFLFEIRRHKLRYKEIPCTIKYTRYSKQKGQSVFNSIRIFFDLVLHKLFE